MADRNKKNRDRQLQGYLKRDRRVTRRELIGAAGGSAAWIAVFVIYSKTFSGNTEADKSSGHQSIVSAPTGKRAGQPPNVASPRPDDSDATIPVPRSFSEAPQLARMVQHGKLPPIKARLPEKPVVLEPVERPGRYGSEWRMPVFAGDQVMLKRTIGYEYLLRWKPDTRGFTLDEVVPNVAEDFRFNDEGTEYTFKLRKGLRWSDGHPLTAEDILFWYEDVFMNKDLTSSMPPWLQVGGKPVRVERVDDYTVVFRYTKPQGMLLPWLACAPDGAEPTNYPAHYMRQFHAKDNKNADQEARRSGRKGWWKLFGDRVQWWNNPEKPTLNAWNVTTPQNV